MTAKLPRALTVVTLLVVISAGGWTLMAKNWHKWSPCPNPPCTQTCDPDEVPNFLCRKPGKVYEQTSWECCCCGEENDKNKYRPLY